MTRLLDLLLIVGILANVVKGADLFLRPHQQKWINSKFESLTLWLEYTRPLQWLSKLTTPKAQIILLSIGSIELIAVGLVALIFQRSEHLRGSERIYQILVLALSLVSLPIIIKRVGPKLTNWLWGHGRADKFLLRIVLLICGGLVFFFIYMAVVILFIWLFSSHASFFDLMVALDNNTWENFAFLGSMVIIWPFFTLFWILTQVSGLVLWLTILLVSLEVLLKVGRVITWRMVEFNRGAYAALILIITIIIGMVDLYLKSQAK